MVLPEPFATALPALVNFDFTDIARGTGYEDYFLIESQDSGGKDYHLVSNRDFSNSVKISKSQATSDLDYDLTPFVIPRTVNGTVLISIPGDGSATDVGVVWIIELYRWDGTTETQLGSTINFSGTLLNVGNMFYFRMPIVNELIAVGETLRLRVSFAIAGIDTGNYGIDPANRSDGNFITTTSKISIPYKLDN